MLASRFLMAPRAHALAHYRGRSTHGGSLRPSRREGRRDGAPQGALVEMARRPRKGSLLAASQRAGWNHLACVLAQLGRRAGL